MFRTILVFLFTLTLLNKAAAQVLMPDGRYRVLTTIINGDTVPLVHMATINVEAAMSPEVAARLKSYYKLRRDVLRTYPYALLAAQQLKFIEDSVKLIKGEKQQKRFIKEHEKELKKRFEQELKKLTVTQGRILIKLIDRETGETSYNLVKELRGSFQAFLWQGVARLFGSNLKSKYEALGEDMNIESIVQQIERGELTYKPVQR
jgi:hypothetical protein